MRAAIKETTSSTVTAAMYKHTQQTNSDIANTNSDTRSASHGLHQMKQPTHRQHLQTLQQQHPCCHQRWKHLYVINKQGAGGNTDHTTANSRARTHTHTHTPAAHDVNRTRTAIGLTNQPQPTPAVCCNCTLCDCACLRATVPAHARGCVVQVLCWHRRGQSGMASWLQSWQGSQKQRSKTNKRHHVGRLLRLQLTFLAAHCSEAHIYGGPLRLQLTLLAAPWVAVDICGGPLGCS